MSDLTAGVRALLAHTAHRTRHVWTWANWAEVAFTAAALSTAVLAWVGLVLTDAGIMWAVLLAALLTFGSTVRATVWNADERFRMDEQLYALREVVVNVNGRPIRFLYGANGWEEAPKSTKDSPDGRASLST